MNKMKHLLRIQLWLLFLCNFAFAQNIPDKPVPPRLVNDFANVLSDNERQSLENKLVAYNDSTSTQIAIVIIQSLEGSDVSQYAVDLGGKWGIGGRKNNNGILILASIGDRKVNISTGYGMEGAVPDISTSRIIREQIVPNFKQANYYTGLDEATDKIISLAAGEYVAEPDYKEVDVKSVLPFIFIILLIFVLIIVFKVRQVNRYARLNNVTFWAAWAIINAMEERKRGRWRGFHGSGGGTWIGGGDWGGGGSSGGGGFGGFGGGSFGGGGSSGSW